MKRWSELTLRAQVTIVVLLGLTVLQFIAVGLDVVQIRDTHLTLVKNRGISFLGEVVPILTRIPADQRSTDLSRFANSERSVQFNARNEAEALAGGAEHPSVAAWVRDQLRDDGLSVSDVSVSDRQIDIAKNTEELAKEFPTFGIIQKNLTTKSSSRKRWTMGVFSIRFEGETDWLNFYLLMAPEDFWPILLARSIDSIVGIGLMVALAFLVGHVMSPLGALTSNAERLGRGEETGALQPEGSIDIREAIVAFNRMEKRIVHALQYQVALLRSLGHDLSGPLDRLRDATEELKSEEARERLVKRLSAVDSIVHSVASFARETRRDPETSRIDLPSLIEALVDEQVENGCDATVSIKTHPVIRGRYNALTRAFRNLIENAIKYGGSAHATVSSEDEMAVLQVEDDGPGIAAESLESAFEPFQRLGASGPGSGLGLSIVQAIIVDHGGTVELTNRSGGGLKATVLLPLEATHHPG